MTWSIAADRSRPIRTLDLLLDRIRERGQVAVALVDYQRAVLQRHEAGARPFDVRRLRRHDRVVLTLAGDPVNAGLTDDARERRPSTSRRLDEAALLGQPLVQRLRAAEQTHV